MFFKSVQSVVAEFTSARVFFFLVTSYITRAGSPLVKDKTSTNEQIDRGQFSYQTREWTTSSLPQQNLAKTQTGTPKPQQQKHETQPPH